MTCFFGRNTRIKNDRKLPDGPDSGGIRAIAVRNFRVGRSFLSRARLFVFFSVSTFVVWRSKERYFTLSGHRDSKTTWIIRLSDSGLNNLSPLSLKWEGY